MGETPVAFMTTALLGVGGVQVWRLHAWVWLVGGVVDDNFLGQGTPTGGVPIVNWTPAIGLDRVLLILRHNNYYNKNRYLWKYKLIINY